jgi:hypothetical protein
MRRRVVVDNAARAVDAELSAASAEVARAIAQMLEVGRGAGAPRRVDPGATRI